jgi:dimethylargininase
MGTAALTRALSPAIAACELSFLSRRPINFAAAEMQHRAYEDALIAGGCRLLRLPPAADLPDAVFVEDTALVLDEIAIITRPGAISRRGEVDAVADALADYRCIAALVAPATLDGGDVLAIGKTLYAGCSARSNDEGRRQLIELVRPFGYRVVPVPLAGCLHLKSAVTAVAPDTLLIDDSRVEPAVFGDFRKIPVPPEEHRAANALALGGRVLVADGCPRTRERLVAAGFETVPVANDELAKAEGGLTCCSLIFHH